MVSERLARIKVAFTTLSTAVLDNREVFRRSSKKTVNTVTLNALYNVNILWPKNVFSRIVMYIPPMSDSLL